MIFWLLKNTLYYAQLSTEIFVPLRHTYQVLRKGTQTPLWVLYWCFYGALRGLLFLLFSWFNFPLLSLFRSLFCLWLYHPEYEGALYPVSYTHLRAHETPEHLVCRLLLEKKKMKK
eukprot:TRINITY_DN3928_c0_g1_i4.p1 TRINITY_DN3928_c0_g1~~TRINITY_DN3928_c0_g1_i4.p1  ORF type:complete len:116 (-),score=2.73 TRINITY_DN3928_c0_g1_i4:19-366(-)